MRPVHLHAENFGSFADLELDFDAISLAAIVGENGAGKSTLLTAVLVALYGTAVGPLDGFVRQGSQGFKVTLDFTAGGQTYRVVREHGKAQKVSLSRDGQPLAIDKVREVDAAIAEAVGYDYASFTVAHWLRQGDLGRFSSLDPAARKEWLVSALGLEVWPQMEAAAKKRLVDERTARAAAEAALGVFESGDALEVANEHEQVRVSLDVARSALKSAQTQAKEAAAQSQAAMPKLSTVTRCRKAVEDVERRVLDAQAECGRLDAEMVRAEGAANAKLPELPDTADLEQQVAALQAQQAERRAALAKKQEQERAIERALAELAAQQRRVDAIPPFDPDKCQTCGQVLHGEAYERASAEYDLRSAAERERLETLTAAAEALEGEYGADVGKIPDDTTAALTALESSIRDVRAIAQQYKERDTAQARLSGLMEAVGAASRALDERRNELAGAKDALLLAERDAEGIDVHALTERETAAARTSDQAAERVSTLEREEARLGEQLRRLQEVAERKQAAEQTLEQSARRASDLELLVKAYGKGGIQARILDVAVRAIEEEANTYLSRFASGMTLSMTTQRENKTGGVRETLDILVTDGMGTRPLERMSGGETTRANFALAVGLSRFLARQSGRVESFVVDEPEYLDSRGLAELVSCLHALADDVPLVLVVSHVESITDSMPQRITVKRGSGGSVVSL